MNSNDFYKSKYSKYKNKYLELKQKNLKINQEGGVPMLGKYLFYIINSEFILNKYYIANSIKYNTWTVANQIENGLFVLKNGDNINDFEELKKVSILIIPLNSMLSSKEKSKKVTYRAKDNTYKDHTLTIENIDLLNYDKLRSQDTDELLNIAIEQIPDLKEQIKNEQIKEDSKIKILFDNINEKNTNGKTKEELLNEIDSELLILKEEEKIQALDVEKNKKKNILIAQYRKLEKEFNDLKTKHTEAKNDKENFILRLIFEVNISSSNKLLGYKKFTPLKIPI